MSTTDDALTPTRAEKPAQRGGDGPRAWLRDRSLGVLFLSLFLVSWVAQLFFE